MAPWIWTFIFLGISLLLGIMEIFVPSGGVLAFLALSALVGSIVFAFQTHLLFGSLYLFATSIGIPIFLWYAFQWWPNTMIGRRILLNPEEDPALTPNAELERLKKLVGKRGVAKSKMMLSGLIEVEGRRLNALSESVIIEPGEEIVVVSVDGINMIVRPTTKKDAPVVQPTREPEPTIDDPFAVS